MLNHHVPEVDSNKCRSNPYFRTNPNIVGSESQYIMSHQRSPLVMDGVTLFYIYHLFLAVSKKCTFGGFRFVIGVPL